ncbi:hybrid sensor histidine kinase/response regulator [Hansschlegelia beijingensis]|uniref:histidine kinase n=1 Tax=Hansschlegelia beijingensis TaxID=1133344 RepID=A0A7W6D856_9HYPH|nr:NahK/ErcS family hybrid sensor histidine kinase/response regulator [Hansschlegelia beijingensis]MBB3974009.1 Na+/proline symporter/signal transduction histidine kinase [Hansschlegelia beijingensis]
MQAWIVTAIALLYLGGLLALAAYADRKRPLWMTGRARPWVYVLGLGVYWTSWGFYGAVGFAATNGWSFLGLSLGPALALLLLGPLIRRMIRVARANNITSVADFVGARYGKSELVAGAVAVTALLGVTPYMALQLKAVAMSFALLTGSEGAGGLDPALGAAAALAVLAMLLGARKVAATEHQDGLMLAVATESAVKLAAFLAVGLFVVFALHDGVADLVQAAQAAGAAGLLARPPDLLQILALTFLSLMVFLLLPRQFHVTVVENRSEDELRRATWAFPLYLLAFNLLIAPIALAGLLAFPPAAGVAPDAFVLALPLQNGAAWLAAIAFLGGLSAASAMVVVESVAVAVMISNDLAMPILLRRRGARRRSMAEQLLTLRRLAIVAVILSAYLLHRWTSGAQLSAIGLVALAAIAQFAPASFGGLFWRRATGRGAVAGVAAGVAVWSWTLVLPALSTRLPMLQGLVADGPWGLAWLRPESLFGVSLGDPLAHGLVMSLAANLLAFLTFSLTRAATPIERQQAALFCDEPAPRLAEDADQPLRRPLRARATVGELMQTLSRYLGPDRVETAFRGFAIARNAELEPNAAVDLQTLRFSEHLLASAIGPASSRLVLSMLLTRRNLTTQAALKLLDEASAAMQTSRDVLQNALDHARQGVTAIDRDMKLVCWNREFRELFDLPEGMLHLGVGLEDIFRFNAARGLYGPVNADEFIADRLERFVVKLETLRTRLHPSGRVIEIRSARMPDGGVVTTYTDITETVAVQEALERANETLERRVRERTRELTRLNQELARAKTEADEANISKTRFLAAASHDILQPLNAARLFATSLVERAEAESDQARLARNVDSSLDAVEEILSTLLDISRLDTGAMKPELSNFRLDEIVSQLAREFAPVAAEKGLKLKVLPTSLTVRSDRRLLRRVLQNLVSNAIKYTPKGRVIVGCRRLRGRVRIEIWDTGLGIASGQQRLVFREFKRLEQGAKVAPGIGLGLSIVERIARVLEHPITLRSQPGRGSVFALELPTAAAMPVVASLEVLPAHRASALKGLAILVIDNEPAILDGMKTLLESWGCTAVTASSEREAEQAIVRNKLTPDVILADYHLDEADGLEAIVKLRWKLGAPIPAALITADRSPGLREKAASKDLQILPKPVRPAALRALLAKALTRRAAAE